MLRFLHYKQKMSHELPLQPQGFVTFYTFITLVIKYINKKRVIYTLIYKEK